MIKYLLNKRHYILLSIIVSFLLNFLLELNINLLEVIFLIFIIRITDDIFDYKKDNGERLKKSKLLILEITLTLCFVILEIFLHKIYAIYAAILIFYIIIMNKVDILKTLLLSLIILYYSTVQKNINMYYLIGAVIISICYYILKRCKDDIRKQKRN